MTASEPRFETHIYGIELSGTTQTNLAATVGDGWEGGVNSPDLMIDLYSICRRH